MCVAQQRWTLLAASQRHDGRARAARLAAAVTTFSLGGHAALAKAR